MEGPCAREAILQFSLNRKTDCAHVDIARGGGTPSNLAAKSRFLRCSGHSRKQCAHACAHHARGCHYFKWQNYDFWGAQCHKHCTAHSQCLCVCVCGHVCVCVCVWYYARNPRLSVRFPRNCEIWKIWNQIILVILQNEFRIPKSQGAISHMHIIWFWFNPAKNWETKYIPQLVYYCFDLNILK